MKRTLQVLLLTLLGPGLVVLSGCEATEGRSATPSAGGGAASDVVAVVAGKEITLGKIEDLSSGGLIRVRQGRYDLLRGTLERFGIEQLMEAEAAERGISTEELRLVEIDGKVLEPTEQELERAYEANKNYSRGNSFQELRTAILRTMRRERLVMREVRYVNELKEKHGFSVSLSAPRVELELTEDNPTKGNAVAPITMVEFGDYQCSYCRRAHSTVQRVLNEYGDQIRYVFVDYPLPNHDRATPAAEATHCAGEQDKYWEYADHLMVMAGDLNDNNLRERAEQVGLDIGEFMSCYTSGRYTDLIEAGLQIGSASGVDRTPTFFINGRILAGAKNYETFKLIIDEELSTLGG